MRTDYYNDPDAPRPNSVVPSASAIVTDELGRILLINRRDNELWALPGGGHDIGETIEQTAIREVKEEPASTSRSWHSPVSTPILPTLSPSPTVKSANSFRFALPRGKKVGRWPSTTRAPTSPGRAPTTSGR